MKNLTFCKQCNHLCGNISVSLGKCDDMLTIDTFCMDKGGICVFQTDLRSIYDLVSRDNIQWWIELKPQRKMDLLKEHITNIVRTDDECEYKVEVMMESWNDNEIKEDEHGQ